MQGKPTCALGLDAPYPIAEKNADAWMVRELQPGVLGGIRGRVGYAEVLDRPEYWEE